jgi:hypothetical protein
MKYFIGGALAILFIVFFNHFEKDKWSLFVYPDGDLAAESMNTINAYESFEECRQGYEFSKRTFPRATFECGLKCEIQDSSLGLYMCKETRD